MSRITCLPAGYSLWIGLSTARSSWETRCTIPFERRMYLRRSCPNIAAHPTLFSMPPHSAWQRSLTEQKTCITSALTRATNLAAGSVALHLTIPTGLDQNGGSVSSTLDCLQPPGFGMLNYMCIVFLVHTCWFVHYVWMASLANIMYACITCICQTQDAGDNCFDVYRLYIYIAWPPAGPWVNAYC